MNTIEELAILENALVRYQQLTDIQLQELTMQQRNNLKKTLANIVDKSDDIEIVRAAAKLRIHYANLVNKKQHNELSEWQSACYQLKNIIKNKLTMPASEVELRKKIVKLQDQVRTKQGLCNRKDRQIQALS